MYKKIFFLFMAYCLLPITSQAQCAMCRASLQGEANVAKAKAVNDGIIYLMIIPYVLVGVMGFFIYKMYRSKK
jgi:heme/copper-type cytochrome/quinol oxidase subunit 2